MNIRDNFVPVSKYDTKCPYDMTPQGICIHNTSNDASAENEVAYMIRNNNETSFHYAVDNVEAIHCVPNERNAWHCGATWGNRNLIGIEICYSASGGERFNQAEENCAQLVASLLKQYGWGLDKVTTHQAQSGKYCPHRTLDNGWERFLQMVESHLKSNVGWIWDEGQKKWWYKHTDNSYTKDNFELIDGYMYYFDVNGWMLSDTWLHKEDKWYYFERNGKIVANKWKWVNNFCYHFDVNGVMTVKDWVKDGTKWFYVNEQGQMLTNALIEDEGEYFFLQEDGSMAVSRTLTLLDKVYNVTQYGKVAYGK